MQFCGIASLLLHNHINMSRSNPRPLSPLEEDPILPGGKVAYKPTFVLKKNELLRTGTYSPQQIICETSLDVAIRGCWTSNQKVVLTIQAFDSIPTPSIQKVKFYTTKDPNQLLLKISTHNESYFYHVEPRAGGQLFSKLVWSRLAVAEMYGSLSVSFGERVEGMLLKKREVFQKWEKRRVVIHRAKGLQSYRELDTEPTLRLASTSEVWTRFDLIQNKEYMVVKLWKGMTKLEFAVPIPRAVEWSQAFCSLLSKK